MKNFYILHFHNNEISMCIDCVKTIIGEKLILEPENIILNKINELLEGEFYVKYNENYFISYDDYKPVIKDIVFITENLLNDEDINSMIDVIEDIFAENDLYCVHKI